MADALPSGIAASALAARLSDALGVPATHTVKYVFLSPIARSEQARQLRGGDYPAYEAFFRAAHPGAQTDGWLQEYFDEIAANGACWGIWRDGRLVCCTDAGSMPFMADRVSEVGINTLPAWQGHGLATDACAAHIAHLLKRGLCPLWSTSADNAASGRLAQRLGFAHLADVIMLTL